MQILFKLHESEKYLNITNANGVKEYRVICKL